MKKIIMICMVFAMVASMSISAFATTGGFASSPSGNLAPRLVDATNESEDCEAQLVITAYGNRDEMSEEARQRIESAYATIIGTEDISSLNAELSVLAGKLGIKTTDLAVSDLFDISATECNGHSEHGHFDITLKADTLNNFVCLLHYYNGEWHMVENAEVTNHGEHLEFDEDKFSPFAIVVSAQNIVEEPTQNNVGVIVAICVAAVAVVGGGIWFAVSFLKKRVK